MTHRPMSQIVVDTDVASYIFNWHTRRAAPETGNTGTVKG